MSRALQELMILTPCEAVVRGARRHTAHVEVEISHPGWRRPQRAHLCDKHLKPFTTQAASRGVSVKVIRRLDLTGLGG